MKEDQRRHRMLLLAGTLLGGFLGLIAGLMVGGTYLILPGLLAGFCLGFLVTLVAPVSVATSIVFGYLGSGAIAFALHLLLLLKSVGFDAQGLQSNLQEVCALSVGAALVGSAICGLWTARTLTDIRERVRTIVVAMLLLAASAYVMVWVARGTQR